MGEIMKMPKPPDPDMAAWTSVILGILVVASVIGIVLWAILKAWSMA